MFNEISREYLEKQGFSIDTYDNGDYKYEDNDWIKHLIRNWEELCKWEFVWSYMNWDYSYEDNKWIQHLIRQDKDWNEVELFQWKYISSFDNKDYKYKDSNNIEYLIRNWKEICQWLSVQSYDSWDYKYQDENDTFHLLRDWVEILQGKMVTYSFWSYKIDWNEVSKEEIDTIYKSKLEENKSWLNETNKSNKTNWFNSKLKM